ncbi:hypothetical protein ASPFODRAFT_130591 [Aspergillus luchuensis CBS 106.47]|uniref:Uncharacterized protein n=1 Tax=Aspergillus luchuensis (strain CBS 106.47) TaxID=1137211 RepID=A0A1M3TQ25_ASPLC|nr:hypothetical protein ASPFODRAFT_130591 [Aspergillus luchuensis CBS 106.47]
MVHHCCLFTEQWARGRFDESITRDRWVLNGNSNISRRELSHDSSEIRISLSFDSAVSLWASMSASTITVHHPGHIQHSTWQTPSVLAVISSTKYTAAKASEDRQGTADLKTTTVSLLSLHPAYFNPSVFSGSRPSRPSTSGRDNDNTIFHAMSRVPQLPPTTIFRAKPDITVSQFISANPTSKSKLVPNIRTNSAGTVTSIASLVAGASLSLSGQLVSLLETPILDSFRDVTPTSKDSTLPFSHHSLSDGDPRKGDGVDQDTAGTATIQLSLLGWDSPAQSTSTCCTHETLPQYQSHSHAMASETLKATPISYPQPVLIMPTYTKPLDTPLSSARVLLYHSGEQPTGTNEKENHIGHNDPDHSDGLSEDCLLQYTISAPSPSRDDNRLTGSDNPQPSTTFDSSPMTSVTTWSEAGFMDHLTTSMTLNVSNGPSRTPKSTNTATTISVYSGSVIDGLRRAQTIPRRSLGMSVSAAVGGTTIFLLIFVLHRPIYRWICRRRMGVIWIGHASAASRSHYTELPLPNMQYPEMSHFSDDSEAGSTEAHRG